MTSTSLNLSPKPSDEMRQTTCYMCACRCGINVHLKEGRVAYIEGNRNHPVNKGVLCAKGSAGIMQVTAPSRLKHPMRRKGERGQGEFEPISWDEALREVSTRLQQIRKTDPKKLAFFTGRDQSQSFTGFWAQMFGTPNYAAHGGFCSVNMATAGIYTMGGAFWEFGQPDWEYTKLFMIFGVAEDHDSNPIKMGMGKLKARGGKIIAVNPIRTGYNAIADEWVAITPGSDGLFILSLVHELLKAGKVDLEYLAQYSDAGGLVSQEEGALLRDENGQMLIWDRRTQSLKPFDAKGILPDLSATRNINGKMYKSVFALMAEKYLDPCYAPETVALHCGVRAEQIRTIAAELARVAFDESFELEQEWTDFRGETHKRMKGRPVSVHAMRGISAHANGFQTCRALHMLQIILGTVEVPGGFRFKPPYPKPSHLHPKPHMHSAPERPLDGPHLGFVHSPDDLCLTEEGKPARIDKAFTWENPLSAHGLMHMVISNAHAGDPYPIDTLFLYMANMAWNSTMDTSQVIKMLTDKNDAGDYIIPNIIYSDAYASEMVAYADIILPDTTYLERHDCISLLDRPICEAEAMADAIRWPVIEPERDVRGFQSVLIDLANRLALPGFVQEGKALYKDYADYIVKHQRKPGIGPLAGFRGEDGTAIGRGAPNPRQLERYIENGGFFLEPVPKEALYYKPWNKAYQDWAVKMGFYDSPQPYAFSLYCEVLQRFRRAAQGHGKRQPPEHLRSKLIEVMDPLPHWYAPLEDQLNGTQAYPLHALTQRPMAMYHSWGSQNAWLRQIHGDNLLYVPTKVWQEQNFHEGDWAKVTSRNGTIEVPVAHMAALNPHTVWTWNAIGKRKGTWGLSDQANESTTGFLLNHLIDAHIEEDGEQKRSNSDPITGQAAWFDLRVRIQKIPAQKIPIKKILARKHSQPQFASLKGINP